MEWQQISAICYLVWLGVCIFACYKVPYLKDMEPVTGGFMISLALPIGLYLV